MMFKTDTRARRRFAAVFFSLIVLFAALLPSAAALEDPAPQAAAAFLADPKSGFVLYEKNADERRYPASTTKIMTALVVLSNVSDLNQKVTVTEEDFEGVSWDSSKAGFVVGEEVPVIDLLYGLLLPSGNESANTLARFVGGSIPAFVDMMNAKADELGCTGTHFVNPNGLHDDHHYTTARDLFLIAAAAMQNETFALISDTAQKTLSETNMVAEHPGGQPLKVLTTNMLIFRKSDPLYYAYAKGIKTGHTSQAGYCLVAAAEKKGSTLISVMLGCEKPQGASQPLTFAETRRLFDWGFENFTGMTLVEQGETVTQIPIRLSTDTDQLVLTTKSTLTGTVPIDIDTEQIERTLHLPDDLVAPVKAGDVIGLMDVSYNGVNYGSVELVALADVSLSEVLFYADKIEHFFQGSLFKLLVLAIVVILLLYFLIIVYRGHRRRKKREQMMRSRYARYRDYDRDDR